MDDTKSFDAMISYLFSLPDLSTGSGEVVGHWLGYWLSALFASVSVYLYILRPFLKRVLKPFFKRDAYREEKNS